MKTIWIITIALCGYFKAKCPKECEVQPEHTHLIEVCRDSVLSRNDEKSMIEFAQSGKYKIKRIDSLKVGN